MVDHSVLRQAIRLVWFVCAPSTTASGGLCRKVRVNPGRERSRAGQLCYFLLTWMRNRRLPGTFTQTGESGRLEALAQTGIAENGRTGA